MSSFDHKTLISNLPADTRQMLLAQTDRHGIFRFTVHVGAIFIFAVAIMMGIGTWPIWVVAALMLIQGIFINFLFTLLHETVHHTPFKTDALNVWVGRLCGCLTLLGPDWFRYFHLAHHRWTHDPEKDPELSGPKPSTTWQYLRYLSSLPEWIDRARTLVRNAVWTNKDSYVPHRGKAKVMREARMQLVLYAVLAGISLWFGSALLIYVWLLPLVLGGPFLRAYLLAEHARCPHSASMLENTRTTFTNRLVHFLAWNMPYHVEHHAYPSVPFHKLPEFHKYTRDHIPHLQDGYAGFHKDYFKDSVSGQLANEAQPNTAP